MNIVYLHVFLATLTQILAQISVEPLELVSILGGSATFLCSSLFSTGGDSIVSIQWLLNSTPSENLELDGVTTGFLAQTSTGVLGFSDISSDRNRTSISCTANYTSGRVETSSTVSLLLVQGHLSAITLNNVTVVVANSTISISLTWTAPFTLDISGVDPDISGYCVDVVNSTSSSTLHSECGITETEFSYPIPPDTDCHIYTFTVTPVNLVGNGTVHTASYMGVETRPEVLSVLYMLLDSDYGCVFSFLLIMSAPVCDAELAFMDLDTGENLTLGSPDLTTTENNITFTAGQLRDNRHYNITVRASNVAGSASSYTTISTHAIQDVVTTETSSSTVEMSVFYVPGCNASGALVLFTDIDGTDVTTSMLLTVDRDASKNYVLPFSLSAGRYGVFVYDIEQDGTLSSGVGYPAVRDQLTLSANTAGSNLQPLISHLENCDVSMNFNLITVMCTYPSDSIVTGFQVVVQSSALDQVGKLYVNQTIDGQTSASVVVEENGEYLVSIIPILEGTGITESAVEHTEVVIVESLQTTENPTILGGGPLAAIIIGGVLGIAIVMILILAIVWAKRREDRKKPQISATSTYDDHKLPQEHVEQVLEDTTISQECVGVERVPEEERVGLRVEPVRATIPQEANQLISTGTPPIQSTEEFDGNLGSSEENRNGQVDHYAALNLSTKAEEGNMMINDPDLQYSTAAGYKHKGQTYVFVDPIKRTTSESAEVHEVSRDFHDGVIYSAIVPHEDPAAKAKGNQNKPRPVPPPPPSEEIDSNATYLNISECGYAGKKADSESTVPLSTCGNSYHGLDQNVNTEGRSGKSQMHPSGKDTV